MFNKIVHLLYGA